MATHSYQAQLLQGATNAGTSYTNYTSVGEVLSISGPDINVTDVETTHLASTNAAKEFIPGFTDGGTISAPVNFVKANMNTIYGFYRTMKGIMVMFNDSTSSTSAGSHWTFVGYWNRIGNEVPADDRITADMTWKVSGKPTFTTGS